MPEIKVLGLVNEDGTPYDPPITSEYASLREKYPICSNWGYACMFCNRCLLGDYFKPTDAEMDIINNQQIAVAKYYLMHNGVKKENKE